MEDKDFNRDKLKLNKVSLVDKKMDIELAKYSNELELYTMILSRQYDNYYTTDANKEDRYSIFTKSNKYYLNDTKFYKIIETYLNLLNGIDHKNKNLIDIFLVKENIFNSAFMEFYGLDVEDYKCFEKIHHIDNNQDLYAKCIYENGYIFKTNSWLYCYHRPKDCAIYDKYKK